MNNKFERPIEKVNKTQLPFVITIEATPVYLDIMPCEPERFLRYDVKVSIDASDMTEGKSFEVITTAVTNLINQLTENQNA